MTLQRTDLMLSARDRNPEIYNKQKKKERKEKERQKDTRWTSY